jgi:hypothetical protein
MELIRHCLTGKDNQTWDIARVLFALIGISFVALAIHAVMHGASFDPQTYGVGAGSILGGGGAGIGMKAKTEPEGGDGHGE